MYIVYHRPQYMLTFFTHLGDTLAALLFPDTCLGCSVAGTILCETCLSACPAASSQNFAPLPKYIHPLFMYSMPQVRKTIWLLKYKNKRSVAGVFAPRLYDICLDIATELVTLSGASAVLLVPVPLHASRQRSRGYNQAELLARAIINQNPTGPLLLRTDVLVRTQASAPHARSHSKSERTNNIKGVFTVVRPEIVSGSHIIIIDDVVTTGSTLAEVRKTLLACGARSVQGVAVAH
jgi:ComF family protein